MPTASAFSENEHHMTDSKQSTQPQLPGPWEALHQAYRSRYRRATGKEAPEVMVEICNGMPIPVVFENRVLEGVARKASTTLANTCQSCGGIARRRFVQFGYRVRCAACHGRAELAEEIREMTEFAWHRGDTQSRYDMQVWHEHELSPHLRAALPTSIWRSTQIPAHGRVRYVCREDIGRLTPWLLKLAATLEKTN
jgi:hypothetical protein